MNDTNNKAGCVLALVTAKKTKEEIVATVKRAAGSMNDNVSLWLWIRGQYDGSSLSTLPLEVVLTLKKAGWRIRNEIVWTCRIGDPAPENRLKRSYEKLYHLSRGMKYPYDRTMGLTSSQFVSQKNKHGSYSTRSGVVGTKYYAQISSSPFLSESEKDNAYVALNFAVEQLATREISDFRLVLRGMHKVTKSVADKIDEHGFCLKTTKMHSIPMEDVWTFAQASTNMTMPDEILTTILRLSCPFGDTVLDLFPSGKTSELVLDLGRRYLRLMDCLDSDSKPMVQEDEAQQDLFTTISQPEVDIVEDKSPAEPCSTVQTMDNHVQVQPEMNI